MNKKIDIEIVKAGLREMIIAKSIIAFKYAFDSDLVKYQTALDKRDYKPFQLSQKEVRRIDKKVTVGGKRIWLFKTVINEMADNGEVLISDSYSAASSNSFSKSYPLTVDSLKAAIDKFSMIVRLVEKKTVMPEWNEANGFLDEADQIENAGKWLSDVCYTEKEMKKAKSDWQKEQKYQQFLKTKRISNQNKYIFQNT